MTAGKGTPESPFEGVIVVPPCEVCWGSHSCDLPASPEHTVHECEECAQLDWSDPDHPMIRFLEYGPEPEEPLSWSEWEAHHSEPFRVRFGGGEWKVHHSTPVRVPVFEEYE